MGRVEKTEAAKHDLLDLALFVSQESPEPGERFYAAAEAAFQRLADMPGMGKRREFTNPKLAGLRSWSVGGRFGNYLLICYREISGGTEVVRILHGAREIEAALSEDE
jgi:toxin ParE1/3/4